MLDFVKLAFENAVTQEVIISAETILTSISLEIAFTGVLPTASKMHAEGNESEDGDDELTFEMTSEEERELARALIHTL